MKAKINQLEKVLQNPIDEYHIKHVKNFHFTLEDIKHTSWCDNCDKIIMKYVYSERNGDEVCCSIHCLDELKTKSIDYIYGDRTWWDGNKWQHNIMRSKIEKV